MSPDRLSKLVNAYVERYSKQYQWGDDNVLRQQDINFWAWEEFERLTNEEPEEAWNAIIAVLNATTDAYVLSNLAAGPLEDLIDSFGEHIIERIEVLAQRDPRFQELLRGVWESSTPDVWARIQKAQRSHDEPGA